MEPVQAPPPQQGWAGWAGGDEWDEFRQTIQELYQSKNMSLKDVMRTMEDKYGFRATQRMYKTRIKSWGLDKNFKESEVVELYRLKRERDRIGKPSAYKIRGRDVDWDRVHSYVKRKGLDIAHLIDTAPAISPSARDVSCRTPSPGDDYMTSHSNNRMSISPLSPSPPSAGGAAHYAGELRSPTAPYVPRRPSSTTGNSFPPSRRPSAVAPAGPFSLHNPDVLRIFQVVLARVYQTVMYEDGEKAWGTTGYWVRNARSQEWIMTMRYKLATYRGFLVQPDRTAAGRHRPPLPPRVARYLAMNRTLAMLEPLSAGIIGTRMLYLVNFFHAFADSSSSESDVNSPFAATASLLLEDLHVASSAPSIRFRPGDHEMFIADPTVEEEFHLTPHDPLAPRFVDPQLDFRESAGRFLDLVLTRVLRKLGLAMPMETLLLLDETQDGHPLLPPSPLAAAAVAAQERLPPGAPALDAAVWMLARGEDGRAEEYLNALIAADAEGSGVTQPGAFTNNSGATTPLSSSSISSGGGWPPLKEAQVLARCANYHLSRIWQRRGDTVRAREHLVRAVGRSLLFDSFVSWDEAEFLFL
ncbi:hypothetical protein B0T19DRAFT_446631 [Cercophora scortea]|uniref:Clr5 domain-containing protein n=1 Tax=Cercophora scortea TaxID=314031 RepID=A0AAE0I325_9PEZI|nr:hypothetical protein B0T19DRAFT_446631 [Cercophora scortea]